MSRLYVGAVVVSMQIFFTPLNAHADEASSKALDSTVWTYVNKASGLITSLPTVTPGELIQEMGRASSNLQIRKIKLAQAAEAKRFKTSDSVIALAMPGGILYAAAKKFRHKQAVQQLNNVSTQLNTMKRSLLIFKLAAHKSEQLALLN